MRNDTIIKYKLIVEDDPDAFDERVSLYLRRGWVLWGSPELAGPFAQAMLLRADKVPQEEEEPIIKRRRRNKDKKLNQPRRLLMEGD